MCLWRAIVGVGWMVGPDCIILVQDLDPHGASTCVDFDLALAADAVEVKLFF